MNRTPDPADRQPAPLEAALAYAARGWSIIPIRPGTKKPACRSWKRYQTTPAAEKTLRRWFAGRPAAGLAVILGPVSGGLVCRDFDVLDSYTAWSVAHPDLAATLPTVATVRGRHVYAVAEHDRIVHFDDGELRGAGYCVLPPSRHPDGPIYRWLIRPPEGPIPRIDDLRAAGFLLCWSCNREDREYGEDREYRGLLRITERTEAMEEVAMFSPTNHDPEDDHDPDGLTRLVLEHLPAGPGRRNRQVFELARVLRSIPWLADAEGNDLDRLEPCLRAWHNEGVRRGVIATVEFTETWIDFLQAWPKVKFPKGHEPMVAVFQKASEGPLPAVAEHYDQPGQRLLVALCRELQRAAGAEPFFLACRTAGRLLAVSHVQAHRWLFLLAHDGVIEVVERGDQARHRASRYRYVAG